MMLPIDEKFSRIFKYMGIPIEQVHPNASFVTDFGFEEFQYNCLAFYIGSYFEIDTRECNVKELKTIGSVVNFVSNKLESIPSKDDSYEQVL